MNLIEKARNFAIEAHKETKYGNLPYEFHLKTVVDILEFYIKDLPEYVITAAWLHDVVEDTDVTLNDIRQEFGGKVARLVDCVTDEPGNNRKERKAGMYKKLIAGPWEAKAIKLADRIANMQASIENPELSSMYRKEFPEFIKHFRYNKLLQNLVIKCFWLYMDSMESSVE